MFAHDTHSCISTEFPFLCVFFHFGTPYLVMLFFPCCWLQSGVSDFDVPEAWFRNYTARFDNYFIMTLFPFALFLAIFLAL